MHVWKYFFQFHFSASTLPTSSDSNNLSLSLELKDAIRVGTRCRVMHVWNISYYFAVGWKNYAIETSTLHAQYHLILPPRLAEQTKVVQVCKYIWIATGHNISCDLHTEHDKPKLWSWSWQSIKWVGIIRQQKHRLIPLKTSIRQKQHMALIFLYARQKMIIFYLIGQCFTHMEKW